jgi:hypothetical protein
MKTPGPYHNHLSQSLSIRFLITQFSINPTRQNSVVRSFRKEKVIAQFSFRLKCPSMQSMILLDGALTKPATVVGCNFILVSIVKFSKIITMWGEANTLGIGNTKISDLVKSDGIINNKAN